MTSGFSRISEKKSIILLALAQIRLKPIGIYFYLFGLSLLFSIRKPLAQASGNL